MKLEYFKNSVFEKYHIIYIGIERIFCSLEKYKSYLQLISKIIEKRVS
jgi:uncharacterized protein YaaN involved in tellurite resistance